MRVSTYLNGNRQPLQPARDWTFDDSRIGFVIAIQQYTQASIEPFSVDVFFYSMDNILLNWLCIQ